MIVFLEFLLMLVVLVVLLMFLVPAFRHTIVSLVWRKPAYNSLPANVLSGALLDFSRSKQELMMENALLRQQLIILRRQVNRPQLTKVDRALLVLLAGRLRNWKSASLIVQPDTLLR